MFPIDVFLIVLIRLYSTFFDIIDLVLHPHMKIINFSSSHHYYFIMTSHYYGWCYIILKKIDVIYFFVTVWWSLGMFWVKQQFVSHRFLKKCLAQDVHCTPVERFIVTGLHTIPTIHLPLLQQAIIFNAHPLVTIRYE